MIRGGYYGFDPLEQAGSWINNITRVTITV